MAPRLSELLETVEVAEPRESGGFQVFGLRWAGRNGLAYTTLGEALAAKTVEVTEVSEGGSVPTLKLVNRAKELVFLLAGEELVGAKQNRVLNADIMAPAEAELPIPVSCVEGGRWGYRSDKFAGGVGTHGKLRRAMFLQTFHSYRTVGEPRSDQGAVWKEIARKLGIMKSASPTAALHQVYDDLGPRLEDLDKSLPAPADCGGVALAWGGRVIGAHLFDKPETLARYWSKLLRIYALDAWEDAAHAPAPVPAQAIRDWVRSAAQAKAEPFRSPGLGQDVRLEGDRLMGAGLVIDDHPVHVELFAREPQPTAS